MEITKKEELEQEIEILQLDMNGLDLQRESMQKRIDFHTEKLKEMKHTET